MAYLARAVIPWRTLIVAGVLSLLGGGALSRDLFAEHRSALPGAGARASAHRGLASLPIAAQGPVSAALGAERAAYRVRSSGGALLASSPAARLEARFGRSGVELSSGAIKLGLGLRAIGYGSSLEPVDAVLPRASANRVSYAHAGFSEWYLNGPLGLEQGFTIPRAPVPSASRPLTLRMRLSGNAHAALSHDAQSVVLSHGSSSLRYGGLIVTGAAEGKLHSWLALNRGALVIRVDTRGARYPLRIDPLIQQGGKLTGAGAEGPGNLGTSVALSADGSTALVGAPSDEDTGKGEMLVGAAWVFTRSGSTWSQQGPKLRGGDREGESQFGISVALSSDGNTALIGGIEDMTAAKEKVGAAWVYTRSGSTWTQQGPKLTGGFEETPGGRFGRSVALSADGNTALIGAYEDNAKKGAAWVFTRSGTTWSHQGKKLTASDEQGEGQFGISVALSSDGNTALIGGPGDEGGKVLMAGAAWAFTRSGGTWTQQGAKLTGGAEESAAGELGTSVALSDDGNTALAGTPADGSHGATWAFTRGGSSWSQQGAKLTPSDATGPAGFGAGVALSADGNTALIGGPTDEHGGQALAGGGWEFMRAGSTWSQQGPKLEGDGTESEFGLAVALSADGDTALLGGPVDVTDTGAAWAFVNPPPGIATIPASAIGTSTATLNGTVNPGASVSAYFQYGTTAAYGASTGAQSLAALNATRGVSTTITGLAPGTTYHYRFVAENSAGVSLGADRTFTTAVPAKPKPKPLAPKLTNVTQSHRIWRESKRLATFARRRRVPVGTTFSFTLNEKATVSFAFKQHVTGRKVRGRCVAQTRSNRRRHACRRTLVRTMPTFVGHAKRNKVSFYGYLSRKKRLPPGSYTLVITASSGGLRSSPKSLSFTIVR